MTIKILNLYAGIGGNRKLWNECDLDIEVTAVEWDEKIAEIYKYFFPQDKMIVGDAHQYLLEHFDEFDFIWSSPPCPSHSRINLLNNQKVEKGIRPKFPDMKLYEEILLLKHWFKGKYCIENVISYYEPLIEPIKSGSHYLWTNFPIFETKDITRGIRENIDWVREKVGFEIPEDLWKPIKNKRQVLNNCTEPELGKHILLEAYKRKDLGAFVKGEKE